MTGTRGRPRDPRRDEVILEAARAEFAQRGYTGASMHEIARRAGVGKDTLYRRWSTKAELAVDVVDRLAGEAVRPVPLEHDTRFNLFVYLKDVVRLNRRTDFGALVAGMIGEAARNPELARPFADFWTRRRACAIELVRDVLGPTATDDDVDAVLDQLFGSIYYRLLLTHAPLSDDYLWDLVTRIAWTVDDMFDGDVFDDDVFGDDTPDADGSRHDAAVLDLSPPPVASVDATSPYEG